MSAHGVETTVDAVVAEISDGDSRGRGECVPLRRYGESVDSVVAAIDAMKGAVFSGLDRDALQQALPPGAARNALDCAFWDIDAKRAYRSVAELAGVSVATVSKVLAANRSTIKAAMTDIRPAARVLRRNTPGLTRLLARLTEFSDVANGVVGATRAQVLQMLRQVSPVLDEFLANRDDLRPSLEALVSLNDDINAAIPGDYANMKLTMQLDKMTPPNIFGAAGQGTTSGPLDLAGLLGASGGGR